MSKTEKDILLEQKFDQLWDETTELDKLDEKKSEKIYKGIAEELEFKTNTSDKTITLREVLKYAAVFLILFSGVAYMFWDKGKQPTIHTEESALISLKAEIEPQHVTLDDKSKVALFSHSTLTYPNVFNDSIREVYLDGSAKFTISENKEKAFLVHVDELTTEVLGTSFTIKEDTISKQIRVYLHTGKIAIYNKTKSFSKILYPGDSLVYNGLKGKEIKEEIITEKAVKIDANTAIDNRISMTFVNVKIKDAYQRIQNQTGIPIDYTNIGIGGDLIITLDYTDQTVDKILTDLNSFSGYSYEIKNNKVYINK
ncbi:FecR family protein [Aquimarina sediminis]|uniref:FecR family protein n=1 Tax=Aquimarina sediminis TaxID=2070536 RepID=UPI000CA0410F|nr:FecR family protein [Aquimarina sediminis]